MSGRQIFPLFLMLLWWRHPLTQVPVGQVTEQSGYLSILLSLRDKSKWLLNSIKIMLAVLWDLSPEASRLCSLEITLLGSSVALQLQPLMLLISNTIQASSSFNIRTDQAIWCRTTLSWIDSKRLVLINTSKINNHSSSPLSNSNLSFINYKFIVINLRRLCLGASKTPQRVQTTPLILSICIKWEVLPLITCSMTCKALGSSLNRAGWWEEWCLVIIIMQMGTPTTPC